MSDRRQRFIHRITYEGGVCQWRILVHRGQAAEVREAACSGARISADAIRDIFADKASKWPRSPEGPMLRDFVDALNFLRVTVARSTGQIAAAGRERTGIDLTAVRDAIDLLAVAGSKFKPVAGIYSPGECSALKAAFEAAQAAKGIIRAPAPPKREELSLWHDAAELIAWHVRRVLAEAGQEETAPGGLLSVVVTELLRVTNVHEPDPGTVRKVLAAAGGSIDISPAGGGIEASKLHFLYEVL